MMKLALLILLCSFNCLSADEVQARVVRHKKPVTPKDVGTLTTNVVAFAESASVNLMKLDGDQEKWRKNWHEALASDSFIHLTFTPLRRLQIMSPDNQGRREQPVSEILVWLPEGHYPGIQVKSGSNYMALTKWEPLALKHLVTDPALELSTVAPYDHFCKLKEPGK